MLKTGKSLLLSLPAILILAYFLFQPTVSLAEETTKIYFFKLEGCHHCAKEEAFLEQLQNEDLNIEIEKFDLKDSENNQLLLQKIADVFKINVSGVPITFIGSKFFVGYQNDEIQGNLIRRLIKEHQETNCPDIAGQAVDDFQKECEAEKPLQAVSVGKIKIPFIGTVDVKNFSLAVLTVMIAAIDGFNPCAMWTLFFLITLLLGMKDRTKMWILGTAFIASSAAVYFLFLAAWLKLFLFLGFIFWIRLTVGLVAVGSGIYYLRKYFKNKAGTCEISEGKKQKKIFEKLKNIVQKEQIWLALGGIIVLAAMVNLIELVCSAGLPAIYTQVLSISKLSSLQYYLYLLLYIVIFMLDDVIVFAAAMLTLKTTGLGQKYSNFSALVGGTLIAILGLLLIFRPEWLMFG